MVRSREISLRPSASCYVIACSCGAKRLCRNGPAWRASLCEDALILDSTMFVHGLPEPITEEQHFRLLHKECPWNPSIP